MANRRLDWVGDWPSSPFLQPSRLWKEAAGLGDTLDIWTWDGDFVGEWRLPKPVSCIAVDYRSHRLYAAVAEPQPNLLEFDTASFGPRGR